VSGLVDTFVRNAEEAGFRVHRESFEAPSDAGVSHAAFALADSGSVVLLASADEPRATSLLPNIHVAIVREETILPGLRELFVALGSDLPSAVAIVTGPSSSADIGQQHLSGIHGPSEVHVVLTSVESDPRHDPTT
jgi:L-lactate dehydrogenase complex protein LldG